MTRNSSSLLAGCLVGTLLLGLSLGSSAEVGSSSLSSPVDVVSQHVSRANAQAVASGVLFDYRFGEVLLGACGLRADSRTACFVNGQKIALTDLKAYLPYVVAPQASTKAVPAAAAACANGAAGATVGVSASGDTAAARAGVQTIKISPGAKLRLAVAEYSRATGLVARLDVFAPELRRGGGHIASLSCEAQEPLPGASHLNGERGSAAAATREEAGMAPRALSCCAGVRLVCTLRAPHGGRAEFRIPGLSSQPIVAQEVRSGVYQASYLVPGDGPDCSTYLLGYWKADPRGNAEIAVGQGLTIATQPPQICSWGPTSDSAHLGPVFAVFRGSAVAANVRLWFDEREVTGACQRTGDTIIYWPGTTNGTQPVSNTRLADKHSVRVLVVDEAGNRSEKRWTYPLR